MSKRTCIVGILLTLIVALPAMAKPDGGGGGGGLKFHHWNWRAFHGKGTAMVTNTNTNGCDWIEVEGHRMRMAGRRRDKGRDVWEAGSFKGNHTVSGKVKFKGKVYTFKIPRSPQVVYNINFYSGGAKPTGGPKPTGGGGAKKGGGNN